MASSGKAPKPYRRRLTIAERKRGYLVLNPRRRLFFPAEGVPFKIKIDDESFETTVEVIRSLDAGPRDPREHYHIHLPRIREMPKGTIVTVARVGRSEYELALD